MNRKFILMSLAVVLSLSFFAFQCSDPNVTSGKLYIQQNNYEKAIESLKRAIEKNPKHEEAHYYLGICYGKIGKYKAAAESFDNAIKSGNKYTELVENDRSSYWAESVNKGLAIYSRAIKIEDKDSSDLLLNRAKEDFESSIYLRPDSVWGYRYIAFIHILQGNNDSAVIVAQQLLKRRPAVESYRIIGEIYSEKASLESDSAKAVYWHEQNIALLEEARKTFPKDPEVLMLLSNAYIGANKLDIAQKIFQVGIESEPGNKYYRYNYGVVLLNAGDFQGAVEQFTTALEIDSSYINAAYNLAVSYVRWGNHLREKADEAGSEDPESDKKFETALEYLKILVKQKSDEAMYWEILGRVYAVLGRTEESLEAFDKADQLR